MSFHKDVIELIESHGSEITIEREGKAGIKSRAFIQPLRYRSNVYRDSNISLGGFTDGRYYLYLGLPSNEFIRNDNAIISSNGKKYTVHTSEIFTLYDKALYVWAVLRPYKEQRSDEYDAY